MKKLDSFRTKMVMNDLLYHSKSLEFIYDRIGFAMHAAKQNLPSNGHDTARRFYELYQTEVREYIENRSQMGLSSFAGRNALGISKSAFLLAVNSAERNFGPGHHLNRDSKSEVNTIYRPGTVNYKCSFNENTSEMREELNPDAVIGEIIGKINQHISILGKFSNSVIFRHRFVDGRKISLINPKLQGDGISLVEREFKSISKTFYNLYMAMFFSSRSLEPNVVGFVKGKSYIDHARSHLGCKSAISVDISKFYDSISLVSIIENNLFYNTLKTWFATRTGLPFEESSFKNRFNYETVDRLFGLINVQFIGIMSFLTHNGLLPTGAHYSPNVSNLLLATVDQSILGEIGSFNNDVKYTRYADDICISSNRAKDDDDNFILNIDLVKKIEEIVKENGFYLNYDKTKIMGPRDRKKIAGIILDHTSNPPRLSIGSRKKLELKERYDGCDFHDLNSSDVGTLNWVNTINREQFSFVCSGISNVPNFGAQAPAEVTFEDIPF